jgi:hypothetical protein
MVANGYELTHDNNEYGGLPATLGSVAVPHYFRLARHDEFPEGVIAGEKVNDAGLGQDILPLLPSIRSGRRDEGGSGGVGPSDEVEKQAAKDRAASQAELAKTAMKHFKQGGANGHKGGKK